MMASILELLDVSRLVTQVVELIPSLIVSLIFVLFFWMTFRVTSVPLRGLLERAGLHSAIVHMLVDNIYRLALLSFGALMALDQIGINVRAALAGLGVAGLAVGFAAQDSLANIFAGLIIFIDKPFLGDEWVSVAGQYGQVNQITLRSTRIRTLNNTYVVIPNKTIIDEVLVNHSKHGAVRVDVPVGIAYKEHIPAAREVLLAAARQVPRILTSPAPALAVTGMGASSVDMEVRVWISDASQEEQVKVEVMEASKLALDAAGIEIPYPHMQLFIEQIEDRVWEKARTLMA